MIPKPEKPINDKQFRFRNRHETNWQKLQIFS